MINARKLAVMALCKVEEDASYSNIVLNELFSQNALTEKDKSFVSALFYGVLDRKITIDYYINSVSKVKVKKMNPLTKQAIRIGVYQLVYMEKVPDSAAVNESVNIIKHSNEKRNLGFVNGVLRTISRQTPALPEPNSVQNISIVYSCPTEIVNGFINDYGFEQTKSILQAFLNPAEVFVRINSSFVAKSEFLLKAEEENISFSDTDYEFLLKANEPSKLFSSNIYKEGLFHIQDIASFNCSLSLKCVQGERVLDVCAAPGGKSFSIAECMNNIGEVVSCDLHVSRVNLIKKGAERLHLSCINAITNDATVYNEKLGLFDAVLCDVPCSGWGVMRRKPEIKYKGETDFSSLESIQKNILNVSSKYVKNGGRLVYSTCTLRKAENERIVEDFLKDNKEFILLEQVVNFPDISDGFFHAVMQKM